MNLPLIRGGNNVQLVSLVIKHKRLLALLKTIINARRMQRQLRLLRLLFIILNASLTYSVGLRVAIGGSVDYAQFILIAVPGTIGGFIMEHVPVNPLAIVFLPLAILFGRGIEDILAPSEKCKNLCKFTEKFHNKQLAIEMKELGSFVDVEGTPTALQFPLDKIPSGLPLVCVQDKLSLLQRYKLRSFIEGKRIQKCAQHFSEFIKKFPECEAAPEDVYKQVVKKTTD